ncbi:TBC1 domain family member 22B-like protein [Dinothrombium tinctorium]|uniref:TBC1 domain family member 22B-like protein n=1 Tax=Dinothrombium tinctorium TaxID=1965070 RepID=A0A3S3PCI7_9ACAR|nr:TBC1 domain family member 22B-like protein [Dinothrombium tinctorium]RWS04354.1 TBC1 domain family member 22B-like protein [Dinothrombium tinctorium]RWS04444.1 TBC1 domain family member 22B-like protein [Dinothrombium tinctorium]RWS09702.1 TBC1 domain family member 22B-like protein [Dinothrombium tinctorium]
MSREEQRVKSNETNAQQFWKQQQPDTSAITAKFPGRVMKQNSIASTVAVQKNDSRSKTVEHRRNNSTSFELFTASCDDAWDSKLDDCVASDCVQHTVRRSSSASRCRTNGKEGKAKASVSLSSSPSSKQCELRTTSAKSSIVTSADCDPKLSKFKKLLFEDDVCDLNQLRSMAWAGIHAEVRPLAWKLLLGYLPVIRSKRQQTLERKRTEYQHLVLQYYNNRSTNDEMWRQIHIDIPRMQPLISIFQQEVVQKIFERILYIWSIRHPASGYVQGMNDLVTPFFVTYLSEFIPGHSLMDVESFAVSSLPDDTLRGVEADSFWSFSKLLDSIQDNYTFAQPGIQKLVNLLARVMKRADATLHEHLTRHGVQYLQFSFRWMNNLLIRELPLRCIVRLWDTYLAEGAVTTTSLPTPSSAPSNNSSSVQQKSSFISVSENSVWNMGNGTPFACSFHLFVCAAFLRFWSKTLLREKDFQGLMLLLQNLPTFHWGDTEIKLLVADAYQLKYTFTPNHLLS